MRRLSDLYRGRLRALLQRERMPQERLSRLLGHSETYLRRKLRAEENLALTLEDIDEILSAIGQPPEVLHGPVLLPLDQILLDLMRARGGELALTDAIACSRETRWAPSAARPVGPRLRAAIERLAFEGLAVHDGAVLRLSA